MSVGVIVEFSEAEDMIVLCPDCDDGTTRMVGVDNRWVCQQNQHARTMEPLAEAVAEERVEWDRLESLLAITISDREMSREAKRALGDQMVEHIKRGKYLAWVIDQQGGTYAGSWWC